MNLFTEQERQAARSVALGLLADGDPTEASATLARASYRQAMGAIAADVTSQALTQDGSSEVLVLAVAGKISASTMHRPVGSAADTPNSGLVVIKGDRVVCKTFYFTSAGGDQVLASLGVPSEALSLKG